MDVNRLFNEFSGFPCFMILYLAEIKLRKLVFFFVKGHQPLTGPTLF